MHRLPWLHWAQPFHSLVLHFSDCAMRKVQLVSKGLSRLGIQGPLPEAGSDSREVRW